MLTSPPDTTETLICYLGLAVGFVGFLLGMVLIITGLCLPRVHRCRSPGSLGVKGGGHICVREGKSEICEKQRGEEGRVVGRKEGEGKEGERK